jgi:DNA uptake protein ComE-like DNA-binding protein
MFRVVVSAALVAGAGAWAAQPAQEAPGRPAAGKVAAAQQAPRRIDINSASRKELMTLPGVGDREARRIVAGRPWSTKIDLVTRGVLPEGVYLSIRKRIVVLNPAMPAARR